MRVLLLSSLSSNCSFTPRPSVTTANMRTFLFLDFPLATVAAPSPIDPVKTLLHHDEKIPYIIKNGCEKYDKMLKAVKAARELANVAVREVSAECPMFAVHLLTMI